MNVSNVKEPTEKMKAVFSAAFKKLSPICVKVTKNCTVEDLDVLESSIVELDSESLNMLQDYLLFPFRLVLCKKDNNEKIMISGVNCMALIFKRTSISSLSTFSDIFLLLLSLISVPGDINKISEASEELKTSICKCLFQMIKNAPKDILLHIFSSTFRLPLAQSFFVLLELLKHEKCKLLQKTILQTISVLMYCPRNFKLVSKEIEEVAANCLVSYLPGLSKSLSHVICSDPKQGHTVCVLSLNNFSHLVCLLLKDSHNSNYNTIISSNETNSDSSFPCAVRNDTWVKEVSGNLEILISNITSVVINHEHWKVRLAFLEFARAILCQCTNNLSNCIPVLLRAVFALSVDNYSQVESYSNEVILECSQILLNKNSKMLHTTVEDDIYSVSSQLVKLTLSSSDIQKLIILKTMQGYLTLLSPSLDSLLHSMPHLERIILSLLNLTEFDCSSINLMEEVSAGTNFDTTSPNLWPKKRFRYFEDEEIVKRVISICCILGCNMNARIILDYLLEKLNSNEYVLQCIFLISNIIKGFSPSLDSSHLPRKKSMAQNFCANQSNVNIELVGDIISELLSSDTWESYINTSHTVNELRCIALISNNSSNKNVFQVCLILEAIAISAQVLKSNFKKYLITILCPVMEKAGTTNLVISQSGKVCLHSISVACGYDSISKLIKDNSDYIVNSMMLNFHQFLHKPEASIVLRVALEESDADVLLLFKDPIFCVFKVLDYNQEMGFSLLQILLSVVKAIQKWYPARKSKASRNKNDDKPDFKAALLEHHKLKQIEMSFTEEPPEETIDIPDYDDKEYEIEEKKSKPLHVEIVTEILTRCIHLQSSPDLSLRVLTLEVIELCVLALSDFNDDLLPLVHNLWGAFVERFSENTIVSMQAFKTLLVLADECGDFIRVRTLKDIFPKLISYLKKQYHISLSKTNFKNYKCTTAYKFQECLLAGIGHLAKKIQVLKKDFAVLAYTCLPYLSIEQPHSLQQAAVKTVEALAVLDSDAMWFYYNEFYSEEKELLPPHPSLYQINFPHAKSSNCSIKFSF